MPSIPGLGLRPSLPTAPPFRPCPSPTHSCLPRAAPAHGPHLSFQPHLLPPAAHLQVAGASPSWDTLPSALWTVAPQESHSEGPSSVLPALLPCQAHARGAVSASRASEAPAVEEADGLSQLATFVQTSCHGRARAYCPAETAAGNSPNKSAVRTGRSHGRAGVGGSVTFLHQPRGKRQARVCVACSRFLLCAAGPDRPAFPASLAARGGCVLRAGWCSQIQPLSPVPRSVPGFWG